MSDFLSSFTPGKYDGTGKMPPEKRSTEAEKKETAAAAAAQGFETAPKPAAETAYRQTVPEFDNVRYELFEKDPGSGKRRARRIIFSVLAVIVVLLWRLTIILPGCQAAEFGRRLRRQRKSGAAERIFLELKEEFNTEFGRGLSTGAGSGRKAFQGDSVMMTVSRGLNPDEHIALPDFHKWNFRKSRNGLRKQSETSPSIREWRRGSVKPLYKRTQQCRDREITSEKTE